MKCYKNSNASGFFSRYNLIRCIFLACEKILKRYKILHHSKILYIVIFAFGQYALAQMGQVGGNNADLDSSGDLHLESSADFVWESGANPSAQSSGAKSSKSKTTQAQNAHEKYAQEYQTQNAAQKDSTQNAHDSAIKAIPHHNLYEKTKLSFLYNAGFDFLMDNTENTQSILWDTRTRYALGVNGVVGLGIFDSHRILFGGYGLQDMGQKSVFNAGGGIYAYYNYDSGEMKKGKFSATLGILPRKKLLKSYPKSFFRDDFLFFNPASNGALLQYASPQYDLERDIKGKAEIVFDWFGGNLAKRYDEFFLLFGSEVSIKNSLNLGLDALMYHFKNSEVLGRETSNRDVYLLDRILYNGYVEVDFRGFIPALKKHLSKAQIGFSALGQVERKRRLSGNEPFYVGAGYEASVKLEYKGFGIEESYYFGKPQMRYFGEYGEAVYHGLPFYSREFNRANAYYLYENKFLRTQISLIFYTFGRELAMQQMLTFSIWTDNLTKPKKLR